MENIVIIGGVAAGATAAAKVRRISSTAEITLIESGPDISFANCGLPYYIGGDIKSRSNLILQSPESFRAQYRTNVLTNTQVTAIDRKQRKLTLQNRETGEQKFMIYSKLILAQGGRPVTPWVPGAGMDHVFSLWTLSDMDRIFTHLEKNNPQKAVVIGGGFIGLEMVEALIKRGLTVSVVEMMPHVMSMMDAETAGFIEQELLAYGVDIHTNSSVKSINAASVVLDNDSSIDADLVLLSVGVRPTMELARESGLEVGETGGLLVNSRLQTSDPDIYAAGDMIEIEHRVHGKKVRIPLAGPANRQGRIAAENVCGGNHEYKGALGTSIVRVFDAVAGSTGLSHKQAKAMGFDADMVVVHKEHHTAYYPNAEIVSVMLVFDKITGIILGGQTTGYKGADKRLDVIAVAAASKLTVSDLATIDFAYSPPIGTANDAINMAAYVAENKMSGYSPSITVSELDEFVIKAQPFIIDVRDVFTFKKSHIGEAVSLPLELLPAKLSELPTNRPLLVYDETGKKGHQALRTLIGAGFKQVTNISGGYMSIYRHALSIGFNRLNADLPEVILKNIPKKESEKESEISEKAIPAGKPLVVDVRTPGEYKTGAYPGAVNIPLDELSRRIEELGNDASRDITVYCASGARSTYAENLLRQLGFLKVKNGGGIANMMALYEQENKPRTTESSIIIDVRTRQEFKGGAFPGAINIPVDELPQHMDKLGSFSREITVYCASGARSSYAQKSLTQWGFSNVKNGGGIMQMMSRQS